MINDKEKEYLQSVILHLKRSEKLLDDGFKEDALREIRSAIYETLWILTGQEQ